MLPTPPPTPSTASQHAPTTEAQADHRVMRLLAPTFALVTAANVLAVSFSKSLFLGHNPYSALPWMFLGAATFTALAAAAYVHVLHRWSLRRRFPTLVALAALSYAALGLTLRTHPAQLSLLAYTWCAGVGTLLVLQTWGHAQALLPVRQARRLFPRFAAAATLGAATGGGLTTTALPAVGVLGLLYVATLLLALTYLLVRRSTTELHEARLRPGAELATALQHPSSAISPHQGARARPPHSGLRAALQELAQRPLLRHIAGLSVSLQVASIALDYQLSASLKATYDTAQLATFFGLYYGAANLTTFALASLGSDRLARWLGVGPAVGAPAITLAAGALAAFSFASSTPLLIALVATSFLERVATFGLARPATAAALTPVDARGAERARFLIDGVLLRLTTALISLALLTAGTDLAAPTSLTPVVLLAGLTATAFALRVGRSYRHALATTLGPGALDALDPSVVRAWTQREARRTVEAHLDSDDVDQVLTGLELSTRLAVGLDRDRLRLLVGSSERALDPARRPIVIQALYAGARLGLTLPHHTLAPLLTAQAPHELTRAALRLLSTEAAPPAPLAPLLERLTEHDDPLVAALALLILRPLRHAVPRPKPARRNLRWTIVERALDANLPNAGPAPPTPPPATAPQPDAAVYDRLLHYLRALPGQLSAADPHARREAQLAMEALRLPVLARPLIEALSSPGPAPAALTALGRLGEDVVGPPLREVWAQGNRRHTHHRLRLLRAAEEVGALDILLDALDGPSLTLRDFAALALWRLARSPGRVPPQDVEALATREIDWLERCAVADLGLAEEPNERAAFVRDELALHRAQGEERTLRLLGIALDRPTFTRILAHYRSPYQRTRSNAVELLDAVLRDTPHHRLVAYLETTERRGVARSYTRAPARGASLRTPHGPALEAQLTELDPKLGAMLRWAHGVGAGGGLMDRAMLLHAIPLFADTPADQLLALAEVCRPTAFEAGEIIFRPGDAATHLYLLERGHVEILREQRQVAVFGPRDAFGELAILGRAERNTTARALDDVDSLVLAREDFEALLDVSPSLAKATIAVLTERLRKTLERLG